MPLIKSGSKKALNQNIKTEMDAHPGKANKDRDLAIAFSVQRKNKKKHMADGGQVDHRGYSPQDKEEFMKGTEQHTGVISQALSKILPSPTPDNKAMGGEIECMHCAGTGRSAEHTGEPAMPMAKPDDQRLPDSETMGERATYGSPPPRKPDDHRLPEDEYMADHFAHGGSIAEAIMHRNKMAAGGEVDLEENNATEGPGMRRETNLEANGKELYDDDQLSPQPTDSNEHGDAREMESENEDDHIDNIRKRMKRD